MTITRMFTVYLNRTKQPPLSFNVNQYDRGEKWVFTILEENGTEYTPTTCSIVGRKSDGTGIAVEGTVENGKAVIYETEQMTAAPGKAVFELSVDNLTHGTANFIVNVEKRPLDEAVMSESDLSLIQQVLDIVPENEGTEGQVLTKTATGAEWDDAPEDGFRFTITLEEVNGNLAGTCDHTAEEIFEAMDNGERIHGTVLHIGYDSQTNKYVYESEINEYRIYESTYYTTLYFYCATNVAYSNEYSVEQLELTMYTVGGNMVQINKLGVKKIPDALYIDIYVTYEDGAVKRLFCTKTWSEITEWSKTYKITATINYTNWDTYERYQCPAYYQWHQGFDQPAHFRSIVLDGQTLKEMHVQVTNNDEWSFEINTIGE